MKKLADEEQEVERELKAAEERVGELRMKRERVRRKTSEAENRLETRLSSWKGSLREVERETESLVQATPRPKGMGAEKTLETVSEAVEKECSLLVTDIEAADREKEACLQGGKLWRSVIQTISRVEDGLRDALSGRSESPPSEGQGECEFLSIQGYRSNDKQRTKEDGMTNILNLLSSAITSLQPVLQTAEDRDWRFLTCAIGAELEALREGKEMLTSLVGVDVGVGDGAGSEIEDHVDSQRKHHAHAQEHSLIDVEGDGGVELGSGNEKNEKEKGEAALSRQPGRKYERNKVRGRGRRENDEDEDEEPGPDLLVEEADGSR